MQVDARPFNAYTTELAVRINPQSPKSIMPMVIRQEAGSVIKTAAGVYYPKGGAKKLADQRRFNAVRRIEGSRQIIAINSGRRGGNKWRAWYGVKGGNKPGRGGMTWYLAGQWNNGMTIAWEARRFPDSVWREMRAMWANEKNDIREAVNFGREAVALSQQSWLQILESLDLAIPIASIPPRSARIHPKAARARNRYGKAVPPGGRSFATVTPTSFSITTQNTSPLAIRRRGAQAVESAIAIRAAAFHRAVGLGVFSDAKRLAQLYPGMTVLLPVG